MLIPVEHKPWARRLQDWHILRVAVQCLTGHRRWRPTGTSRLYLHPPSNGEFSRPWRSCTHIAGAMASAFNLRERGWDHGLYVAVASSVAVGMLLGLTETELGHAVSLALVPQIPLRQTRAGELSMWKGCATAAASRGGMFAAQLARLGMTGPDEPFEG